MTDETTTSEKPIVTEQADKEEEKDEDFVQVEAAEEEAKKDTTTPEEKEKDITAAVKEEEEDSKEEYAEKKEQASETKKKDQQEKTPSSSSSLKDQIRVVVPEKEEDETETITSYDPKNPVQVAFDNTKQSIEKVVKDAQKWSEENVAPHIETAKTNTAKTMENIGTGTRDIMDKHVAPHVEHAKMQTRKSLQQIGSSTRDISTKIQTGTKNVVDQHVVPNYQSISRKSSETAQAVATSTRQLYTNQVQPHVTTVVQHGHFLSSGLAGYAPCFMGTAPELFCSTTNAWYWTLLEGTMRSFGQVAFCNNPITGMLVWIAVMFASPLAGTCALVCVLAANVSAWYLEMDTVLLRKGLLGYSAVLVGSGIGAFFDLEWTSIFLSLLAGPMSVLAYVYTASKTSWPLHVPAMGVLLLLLLSVAVWDSTTIVAADQDDDTAAAVESGGFFWTDWWSGISGMYLLHEEGAPWWAGVVIVCGMMLCSRILAAAALCGSLLGLIPLFGAGGGVNAALTVVSVLYFVVVTQKSMVLAVFGGLLALVLHGFVKAFFSIFTIPITTMTIPFCLAALPILVSLDSETLCGRSSALKLIPLSELSTPEGYLTALREAEEEEQEADFVGSSKFGKEEPTEETPLMSTEVV